MKTPTPSQSQPQPSAQAAQGAPAAPGQGTAMKVGEALATYVEQGGPSLFSPEDAVPERAVMPDLKLTPAGKGFTLAPEGRQGFTVQIKPVEDRPGTWQAHQGHTKSMSGISLEDAQEWGKKLIVEEWKAYMAHPAPAPAVEAIVLARAEKEGIPAPTYLVAAERTIERVEAKDYLGLKLVLGNLDNKVSRAVFESLTGETLPKTQSATLDFVRAWVGEEIAEAAEQAAQECRMAKEAVEAERNKFSALDWAIRTLETNQVRLPDKSLLSTKDHYDGLLAKGFTVRFRGAGKDETVDLVEPGTGAFHPLGKDRAIRTYLRGVQEGMIVGGQIAKELSPDWKEGLQAAEAFVAQVGWTGDPAKLGAEASEEVRDQARTLACKWHGFKQQAIVGFLGIPPRAPRPEPVPEVPVPTPGRVPGGGYPFPKHTEKAWGNIKLRLVEPNPDQQALLEAAGRALDAGVHYQDEFAAFVVKDLGPEFFTAEDLAQNKHHVVNGDSGYEIYHARKTLEAWRHEAANLEAAKTLKVGSVYKDVRIGSEKYSSLKLESVDLGKGKATLYASKRGSSKHWYLTMDASVSFLAQPKK